MTTQRKSIPSLSKDEARVRYREVYTSDLKAIQELYQQKSSHYGKLDHNFGMPVFVAIKNGRTIAYAALRFTDSGLLETYICTAEDIEEQEPVRMLRQLLFDRAKTYLKQGNSTGQDNNTFICASYGFSDIPHFQRAVQQLTQWLHELCVN